MKYSPLNHDGPFIIPCFKSVFVFSGYNFNISEVAMGEAFLQWPFTGML